MFRLLKSSLFVLAITVCITNSYSQVVHKNEAVKVVQDAKAAANTFHVNEISITGAEHLTSRAKKSYVVLTIGSEGHPPRFETRYTDVLNKNSVAHNYDLDKVAVQDLFGNSLSKEVAVQNINKVKAFLVVKKNQMITEDVKNLYNRDIVVIRLK